MDIPTIHTGLGYVLVSWLSVNAGIIIGAWWAAAHVERGQSPDGDTLATLDGCWITEAGEDFSDFVVFHRENDLTESPTRPGTEASST